ncbi:hypothetical protein [Streptococcus parauberis]|uniref:YolD-like protein n=1 Tax=Streptococcus parauberis TaxID=1348 RepID=A0AAE4L0T3_9STRE|nr:hypothetical protein [Streptococcus parauberis]MDT2731385.1 hypothetical protein [Streptococcus parauberis]
MIDRSYLPFASARSYYDRKMAKWMGFFLSEHNHSLEEDRQRKTVFSLLDLEEKQLLLSQAYSQQLPVKVRIFEDNQLTTYLGKISRASQTDFQIKSKFNYYTFPIELLISIDLQEELSNHDHSLL